ncbi:MAG: hypothetical protein L0213_10815, partial [Candidatus Dadabacteria bacterium]|nr:hypothetical protein [Candidatus Dadabacteria bacterium]
MGREMFRKQCEELGVDPDSVRPRDLPALAGRLSWMAKTVAGAEKATRVYSEIGSLLDMDSLAEQEAGGEQRVILENLAKAGIYAGDWDKAGSYLDRLIERAREADDHRALSEHMIWKGVMY